jgi:hypothetical protein
MSDSNPTLKIKDLKPDQVAQLKLSSLQEFERNAELFPDSLTPEAIQPLADSFAKHGQAQPVLVALVEGKYTIVDGHRRYRAAQALGWRTVAAKYVGELTPDEAEGRVLDCYSSARKSSLREQARIFDASRARLVREHGNTHGGDRRPDQEDPGILLSRDELDTLAAKTAGVSSGPYGRRLSTIFSKYAPGLQALVNIGKVTVSRAHEVQRLIESEGLSADEAMQRFLTPKASASAAPEPTKTSPSAAPAPVVPSKSAKTKKGPVVLSPDAGIALEPEEDEQEPPKPPAPVVTSDESMEDQLILHAEPTKPAEPPTLEALVASLVSQIGSAGHEPHAVLAALSAHYAPALEPTPESEPEPDLVPRRHLTEGEWMDAPSATPEEKDAIDDDLDQRLASMRAKRESRDAPELTPDDLDDIAGSVGLAMNPFEVTPKVTNPALAKARAAIAAGRAAEDFDDDEAGDEPESEEDEALSGPRLSDADDLLGMLDGI